VGLTRLGFTPCSNRLCAAQTHVRTHTSRGTCTNVRAPRKGSLEPSQRAFAPATSDFRRTTASCTCTSSFSPCKGQVCTSRKSIRACASLMCAAHVASRPHQSALTVQEHVMTLARAHARWREEHCARTKHYGACLERVAPRRRGNAHALSPWFATPVDAYLRATPRSHLPGKEHGFADFVFDDSQSSSTAHPGFASSSLSSTILQR